MSVVFFELQKLPKKLPKNSFKEESFMFPGKNVLWLIRRTYEECSLFP